MSTRPTRWPTSTRWPPAGVPARGRLPPIVGIGRHIQGSQVFDYWRDPDRFMVEHYADGDVFDNTLEPGWSPMSASGLAQWGPPATADFLGTTPSPALLRTAVSALREDNEIDMARLVGLMKAMKS